ncbi:MAG: TfoX/Sxy family protein [Bacteroidota bacterium]|nr:TfoX/Sxy family protein [Bacteroidota bacterium]MDP4253892.1 TfoX/Sxy family protein [Bacteroidota bacterium]MDP4260593.1 TfoX/Sxy family protein [Bacteroidota bacterium]
MPVNEQLLDRVRELVAPVSGDVEEKKMFSGICLMVNDKMCIAVSKDRIMVRFDPARTEEILEKEGTRAMFMSGRSLDGYVYVDEGAVRTQKQLAYWVGLALDYNQFAKSSKKKKAAGAVGRKTGGAGKKSATGKKSARKGTATGKKSARKSR